MANPVHAYTQALISAVPTLDPKTERSRKRIVLQGDPPSPIDPPKGCSFASRSWIPHSPKDANLDGVFMEIKNGHFVEVHPATVENHRSYLPDSKFETQ